MSCVVSTVQLRLRLLSEADRRRFANLLEFARHGRVIAGWQSPDEGDVWDGDGWAEDVPVYDHDDRSNDPWFGFAYVLELCQWFNYDGFDEGLVVSTMDTQPELLEQALERTPFPVEIIRRGTLQVA
jgi:hypothetical protein